MTEKSSKKNDHANHPAMEPEGSAKQPINDLEKYDKKDIVYVPYLRFPGYGYVPLTPLIPRQFFQECKSRKRNGGKLSDITHSEAKRSK